MRVVGGRLGGRTLQAPRGRATRPTPERVREALFSILGSVEDAHALDLFAGSGALGIEALSRGAAAATLVDSAASAVAAIRRNLSELGLEADVRREDALAFLRRASRGVGGALGGAVGGEVGGEVGGGVGGIQYDLVFLDPPYRQATALGSSLSEALEPVLAPGARVVAESDRRAPLELALAKLDERRYGDTLIRIYRGPR